MSDSKKAWADELEAKLFENYCKRFVELSKGNIVTTVEELKSQVAILEVCIEELPR